ncbi:hypothetical protein [Caulobacter sp. Root1472]|uniref:hypothetical protein n=1 Tax=Caulobacter sp. Root1472 TaxID=1736470 RepID=UPI0012E337DB|nr:hypothetical protein [Caulobacter sp. Root1472]
MKNEMFFDEEAQKDLMSAAVRLYEADMYDHCMIILNLLIKSGLKEAYVLAGHCVSAGQPEVSGGISNAYYEAACELGSAVGCYNLHLNYQQSDESRSKVYLERARALGWVD